MAAVPDAPGVVTITRGDTFTMRLTFWADTAKTQPYDLTGAALAAELRTATAAPVLATFTTALTAPNIVDLGLSSADAAALPFGTKQLSWDVQATWPPDTVVTLVKGKATVPGDITGSDDATPGPSSVHR